MNLGLQTRSRLMNRIWAGSEHIGPGSQNGPTTPLGLFPGPVEDDFLLIVGHCWQVMKLIPPDLLEVDSKIN